LEDGSGVIVEAGLFGEDGVGEACQLFRGAGDGLFAVLDARERLRFKAQIFGDLLTAYLLRPNSTPVQRHNFFTGIDCTAYSATCMKALGMGNPLATTQMALLTASANLPIGYYDGHR